MIAPSPFRTIPYTNFEYSGHKPVLSAAALRLGRNTHGRCSVLGTVGGEIKIQHPFTWGTERRLEINISGSISGDLILVSSHASLPLDGHLEIGIFSHLSSLVFRDATEGGMGWKRITIWDSCAMPTVIVQRGRANEFSWALEIGGGKTRLTHSQFLEGPHWGREVEEPLPPVWEGYGNKGQTWLIVIG